MEHKFYTDNFERLLKEKSDEFRMYPSKRVWHSIYNDLHPDRKWPSIAVSLVLVTVLFLIGYWNNSFTSSDNKQTTVASATAATNGKAGNNTNTSGSILTSANNQDEAVTAPAPASFQQQKNLPASANTPEKRSVIPSAVRHTNTTAITGNAGTITTISDKELLSASRNKASQQVSGSGTKNTLSKETAAITEPAGTVQEKNMDNSHTGLSNTGIAAGKPVTENNIATGITANTKAVSAEAEGEGDEVSAAINPLNNTSEELVKGNMPGAVAAELSDKPAVAKAVAANNKLSSEDKSWIEHYALYNKRNSNRWKGRLSSEIYITPGIGFRKMTTNTGYAEAIPAALNASPAAYTNTNAPLTYTPGLSFEVGAGWSYAVAKNIRLKAGIQANFTNYSIDVTEINHPVITTLLLNNLNNGRPYLDARVSSLANVPGFNNKRVHNQTSQISLPLGVAVKLKGNEKLEWYAGVSMQPAYIFGGKANLISSDHNNYVADASMLRSWNLNSALETYIHYKMNGFTLQAGPEFRYQLISTYSQKYTYNENLYNIGVKVGIVKNF
jgi:hypothetical protein